MKNTNLILIMARESGKKDVSKQNLRLVNGKPLLYYVLKTSLKCNNCYTIISTDSDEVKQYAKFYQVPVLDRSKKLTKDDTKLEEIAVDALNKLEKKGLKFKKCLILHPHFPLIKKETIQKFFSNLNEKVPVLYGYEKEPDDVFGTVNKKFELIQSINSKEVDVSKNNWVIKNANISKNNFTQKNVKNIIFKSHFDIEKINNLFSNLSSLTFWQLKKLKKDYKSLGYSTLDINSHLEKIYAYPIYLSIMTLFAGIIMLNVKFNKPKIFNIILGILLSVVIYYINYFSNILGENGKISTTLSVWMPLLILSLISSIGLVRINEK